MAATADTIACPLGAWTQLTSADTVTVSFQVKGIGAVELKATTGVAPTNFDGALRYKSGQGEAAAPLLTLFGGVAGVRLWAYATDRATSVAIQHD